MSESAKRRGRPVLGAVSGFFLGVFLAVVLQQFGVRPLDNLSVIGLPLLGLVAGWAAAYWAPFGGTRPDTDSTGTTDAPADPDPPGSAADSELVRPEYRPE